MGIEVVAPEAGWAEQFAAVAADLSEALAGVSVVAIEHVGSTAVPGLAAKPILDIDVLVAPDDVAAGIAALERAGYAHRGDLGLPGREAFRAPDDAPRRHVYLSTPDNLQVRNHLTVRDVLRARPDLRDEYAAVKQALAADPAMDIDRYIAGKSEVLQKILAAGAMGETDRRRIADANRAVTGR